MTAPATTARARRAKAHYRLAVATHRCPACGRRARARHVKCRRCGAADNERAKRRYAMLVRLAALAGVTTASGTAVHISYPAHD